MKVVPRNDLGVTDRQMQIARRFCQKKPAKAIAAEFDTTVAAVRMEWHRVKEAWGFEGYGSGAAAGYVLGVYDSGLRKTARKLCPALLDLPRQKAS